MYEIISKFLGFFQIFICGFGALIATKHYVFFKKSQAELAKDVSYVFITDALIYCGMAIAGYGALMHSGNDFWMAFRVFLNLVVVFNIIASVKLYRYIRTI